MRTRNYLLNAIAIPITTAILSFNGGNANATQEVEVICDIDNAIPTVTATLSNSKGTEKISRKTDILSFLPEYFSPEEASINCQKTAESLQGYYARGEMNYLASDTIDGKPVICALERRGISCDGYRSEILFSLNKPVNPSQLLYNMLGKNFKDSQIPSSRTVSRIYTDLRPTWWPFEF